MESSHQRRESTEAAFRNRHISSRDNNYLISYADRKIEELIIDTGSLAVETVAVDILCVRRL